LANAHGRLSFCEQHLSRKIKTMSDSQMPDPSQTNPDSKGMIL